MKEAMWQISQSKSESVKEDGPEILIEWKQERAGGEMAMAIQKIHHQKLKGVSLTKNPWRILQRCATLIGGVLLCNHRLQKVRRRRRCLWDPTAP